MADFHSLSHLREVLAPEYAIKPSPEIRQRIDAMYGPGSADAYNSYIEGIFDDIGNALSSAARDVGKFAVSAAPAITSVGGGALQGALSGAQFGLPGIIAGAALGGTGAGLQKYGGKTAGDIGGALSAVTGISAGFSPVGRVAGGAGPAISGLAGGGKGGAAGASTSVLTGLLAALGDRSDGSSQAIRGFLGGTQGSSAAAGGMPVTVGSFAGSVSGGSGGFGTGTPPAGAMTSLFGGSTAASQLLSLLQRPETIQALAALNLGPIGRRSIPVGLSQTQVPTAAIASLLGHLAGEASIEAADWASDSEAEMTYMIDAGDYVGDPGLDRDRAARVWNLLNDAQAQRVIASIGAVASEQSGDDMREPADSDNDAEDLIESELQYYDALDLAEYETLEASRFDAEESEYSRDILYEHA